MYIHVFGMVIKEMELIDMRMLQPFLKDDYAGKYAVFSFFS